MLLSLNSSFLFSLIVICQWWIVVMALDCQYADPNSIVFWKQMSRRMQMTNFYQKRHNGLFSCGRSFAFERVLISSAFRVHKIEIIYDVSPFGWPWIFGGTHTNWFDLWLVFLLPLVNSAASFFYSCLNSLHSAKMNALGHCVCLRGWCKNRRRRINQCLAMCKRTRDWFIRWTKWIYCISESFCLESVSFSTFA